MSYKLTPAQKDYASSVQSRLVDLTCTLAAIPAPSNHEEKRAVFIKQWLENAGAQGVYIDEALNVILPINVDSPEGCVVLMAHTDIVFPDTDTIPVILDGDYIRAPGVGDDTVNATMLMLWMEYIIKNKLTAKSGVILALNSGEEGLGNLKGTRKIMETYGNKITEVISFDGGLDHICNCAVGSYRWKITAYTEGGHSYAKFGNKNAIAALSDMISELYTITVPQDGSRTTYNVGLIEGGTSINTIAQQAEMLFEYRSDSKNALAYINERFLEIAKKHNTDECRLELELLGERPCMGDVDPVALAALDRKLSNLIEEYTGKRPVLGSASTDCNIPFSMGIPAAAFGCYDGFGAHTREEWIKISSLKIGMPIMGAVVLEKFN